METVILNFIFGILLLFAGRNLFWLCVGILGFLIGVQCAPMLGCSNEWMALIVALACGALGAVLAVFFEWIAIVLGVGFLGGGYLLMNILSSTATGASYPWPIFVIGGIIGMCLMIVALDMTLIVISALVGASLIINVFQGSLEFHALLFVASMGSGILVQYLTLKGINHPSVNETRAEH